jgi:norsolorinic acid ketoreductase
MLMSGVGISMNPEDVHSTDPKVYKETFNVNTLGPLYLYQATYPLLIASRLTDKTLPPPKFFITSSVLATMAGFIDNPIIAPYGVSKAAVNYLALAIHEQTMSVDAVVIPYHPGTSSLPPKALS